MSKTRSKGFGPHLLKHPNHKIEGREGDRGATAVRVDGRRWAVVSAGGGSHVWLWVGESSVGG